jgi:hypothetical protein
MKFTPGPWEFVAKLTASENHRGFFIRAKKPTRNGKWALAEVQPGDEDGALGWANACLIAAAPELLDAAKWAIAVFAANTPEEASVLNRLQTAIAKADGK